MKPETQKNPKNRTSHINYQQKSKWNILKQALFEKKTKLYSGGEKAMFSLNLSSEQTEAEYLLESGLFQMQNLVNKFAENQHTLLSVRSREN